MSLVNTDKDCGAIKRGVILRACSDVALILPKKVVY